jgi:hypothetical protein
MMSGLFLAAAAVLAAPALAQQPLVQYPAQYPLGQQPAIQRQDLPPLQKQWEDRGQAPVPLPPSRIYAPLTPPTPRAPLAPPTPAAPPSSDQPDYSVAEPTAPAPEAAPPARESPAAEAPRPTPDMTPLTRPNTWLPATTAKLQALDKVNAQTTMLTVKVGQTATFGSLTIAVKACIVRPPDQPPDAAAYLDVTDRNPDTPPFAGWLLEQEPSASMMEHPIYDIRVTGCT